jgi:uncharacterized protein YegL
MSLFSRSTLESSPIDAHFEKRQLLGICDEMRDMQANPEQRVPCGLVLDTSSSMAGSNIKEVQTKLNEILAVINENELLSRRVEIAIVTIGWDVTLLQDFTPGHLLKPVSLTAEGVTPLAEGILMMLAATLQRRKLYGRADLDFIRPFVIALTDGYSTSPEAVISQATQFIREVEAKKQIACFAFSTKNANVEQLARMFVREPLKIKDARMKEFFAWLLRSLTVASQSLPGERLALPNPLSEGWAELS